MIDGKKVLAVITARGGSKGLPGKNVRQVGGKPLVAWSIAAANASSYIDRLILSSDDEEIIETAKGFGCEAPFVRPAELAGDGAPSEEVLIHALDNTDGEFDYLVLLQPTSPLRRADDIDACLEACRRSGAPACVTVTPAEKSPYWMYALEGGNKMRPLLTAPGPAYRRQDLPAAYALNGAVFVAEIPWFRARKTFVAPQAIAHVMPRERSLDVDTALDLLFVEAIMAAHADADEASGGETR